MLFGQISRYIFWRTAIYMPKDTMVWQPAPRPRNSSSQFRAWVVLRRQTCGYWMLCLAEVLTWQACITSRILRAIQTRYRRLHQSERKLSYIEVARILKGSQGLHMYIDFIRCNFSVRMSIKMRILVRRKKSSIEWTSVERLQRDYHIEKSYGRYLRSCKIWCRMDQGSNRR